MSGNNIIKFGKARKALARKQNDKKAEENRIKFGRTKVQKQNDKNSRRKHDHLLDNHKIDK